MNINSNDDGMVPLNPYVPPRPEVPILQEQNNRPPPPVDDKFGEKNIQNNQSMMMDSTPISDIMDNNSGGMAMMEPPMMQQEPRMQSMMMSAPQPTHPQQQMMMGMGMGVQQQEQPIQKQSGNPLNLTDDQMEALLVGICAVIAVSKPVQEKLASSIPRFTNEMGGRSAIGLASTGLVAALAYYITQRYILKK